MKYLITHSLFLLSTLAIEKTSTIRKKNQNKKGAFQRPFQLCSFIDPDRMGDHGSFLQFFLYALTMVCLLV